MAPVSHEHVASDVGSAVAEQKCCGLSDFIGAGETAHGNTGQHAAASIVGGPQRRAGPFGLRRPGGNTVQSHSAGAPFDGQCAGHRDDAALGGRARSTFGERGARIVMVAVSTILAAAWSAVLAIMFGHGLVTVVNNVFGLTLPETGVAASLLALIAIVVSWAILARGPISVEAVCRAIAPLLILIVAGILVIVFSRNSWSELSALAPLGGESDDPRLSFMLAVELNLAGGSSWWPNLGNLARLTKTSRAGFCPTGSVCSPRRWPLPPSVSWRHFRCRWKTPRNG